MASKGKGAAAQAPRDSWEGSLVTEEEICRLQRMRRIPPTAQVECRALGDKLVPAPWQGKFVVFAAHFSHGFGLPVSPFFHSFLDFFALQPHHLGANVVLVLSCFVSFCEGYAGL
jgi:hypothetical protein